MARSSGLPLTAIPRASGQLPAPPRSFNPIQAAPVSSYASMVWAPPRSLAATQGILSAPRGTQMFHFPRFPPGYRRVMGRAPTGLPHSDPPGSQAASASPGHFAAWPRPSSAAIAKASTLRPSSGRLSRPLFHYVARSRHARSVLRSRPVRASKGRILRSRRQPDRRPSRSSPGSRRPCSHRTMCYVAHTVRVDEPARPTGPASSTAARPVGPRVAHCQGAQAGHGSEKNEAGNMLVLTLPPLRGGRAWTRTRDLGLIRAAL